jgi:hypothetical protein
MDRILQLEKNHSVSLPHPGRQVVYSLERRSRNRGQIRNLKSQIPNLKQIERSKSQSAELWLERFEFVLLVLGICLGFGASNFGFLAGLVVALGVGP